jgi:diguanylate cyclase (GGDEF)-like protein/PAS domain S-box-containing protein
MTTASRPAPVGAEETVEFPSDSEAFYRFVVDNVVDGFFVIDRERRFVKVNDAFCRLFGYQREQIIGRTPPDFAAAESRPELLLQMRRIDATEHRHYQLIGLRSDGRKFPIFLNSTTYRDASGEVAGAFGFVTDLTSIAEAEQALAASERELQGILDNMQDTYYRTDVDGNIVRASKSVQRLLGYAPEELLGRPLASLYFEADERADFLHDLAAGDGALSGVESRLRHKDGRETWVLTNAQYVRDGDGRVVGVEGTTRDNTERRHMVEALKTSETRLSALIETLPDAVFLKDGSGRWQIVNAAGIRLFRLAGEEWLGKTSRQIGAIRPDLGTEMRVCYDTDEEAWRNRRLTRSEEVLTDADGAEHHWEFLKLPLFQADGSRRGLVVVARDLTERRRAEEDLRLAAQVFENSGETIIIMDAERRIVSVNRAFTEMTGYLPDEVLGREPQFIAAAEKDQELHRRLWHSLAEIGYWQGEVWSRRKNGESFPEWLGISTLRDATGEVEHYVAISSDISERKAAQARIEFLAHHDPLTDLPNRLLFKDRLERAIAHGDRTNTRVALLFIDLDRFKTVNDSLGHPVGDRLLQEAAQRLLACVRDMDTVSRQGGDEFLIMLAEITDADTVTRIVEDILLALAVPFFVDGHEVAISCSVGIAVFPEDGREFDGLLKRADIAMYHAKEAGRNAFRYYTERMNIDALERLDLQNRLRRGLEQNEFVLYYQPLVEMASNRIVGAEALVRWHGRDLGLGTPARFITIAEESGLIVPLGEWVLREACRELRLWHDAGHTHLSMAVNLSAIQFRRGSVEESVMRALGEAGADPAALELELTESILLQGTEHVLAAVRRLKALGIRLSIDDFGTGYSSLAYLKRFAVDKLKIDQSFVRDLATDSDSAAIVRAVIQMAKSLNLLVLAEGVETDAVADNLRLLRCDYAQGLFFGAPLPAPEFRALIESQHR